MIRMQLKVMFSKWEFWVVFLGCMALSVYSAFAAANADLAGCSAEYQYMGNVFSEAYSRFMAVFPFLVVVPYAMSLVDDLSKKTFSTMVYRSSVRNYLAAKYIAVFVGNVLFVLLPFLVNYALCRLLYPVNASNPFGSSLHAEITGSNHAYRTLSSGNPFAALFFENQTVFYLIYLLILCLVSAVLGIFVLSVSVWLRKYRILLFLPVYLILRIGSLITEISFNEAMENHEKIFVNFDLSDYLAPFGMGGTYYPILILFLLLLLLFSAVSYLWFCKKEYLNV